MPATFRFLEFFCLFPVKLVYFWTESRKGIYECFFYSFCATDINFGIGNNGSMKLSTLKTPIFSSYWGSPSVQFSKFYNFLRVCRFLCKNLSNFVYPVWKLHNPYCHNVYGTGRACGLLRFLNWKTKWCDNRFQGDLPEYRPNSSVSFINRS